MDQPELLMKVHVVARVTGAPRLETTTDGVAVCRFVLSGDAAGPASSPSRLPVYVTGAEARKCARLRLDDVVEVAGKLHERQRVVRGVEFPEASAELTERVKLRYRRAEAVA